MATRKTAAKPPARRQRENGYDEAWNIVVDRAQGTKKRIAALAKLGWQVCADKPRFRAVLAVLKNRDEPMALRQAALSAVQSATFDGNRFAPHRPDYISALRAVAQDPELDLRQRALGLLAREHDAPTQELLLEGLQDPAKALLPPEKALQLMSYDVHSQAYAVARRMAADASNPLARREALRLLAADGASAPMFESILKDKREPGEIRQLAASALHALAPQRLQACARDIAMDDSDDPHMQSVSLTALAHFGGNAVRDDDELHARAQQLANAQDAAAPVAYAAAQLMQTRTA